VINRSRYEAKKLPDTMNGIQKIPFLLGNFMAESYVQAVGYLLWY
jgi:hypothetical protein